MTNFTPPTFRVGEEICSKTLMGRIQFAYRYEGTWFYILEQIAPSDRYSFEQIQEIDVVVVWRNGRWTGR